MSRRGGTERRTVIVSFRLSPLEAAHVDAAGAALNNPRHRADFARAATLSAARHKIPPPTRAIRCRARHKPAADVEQLTRILGQLGRLDSSVTQLATTPTGESPVVNSMKVLAQEIKVIRALVMNALQGGCRDH